MSDEMNNDAVANSDENNDENNEEGTAMPEGDAAAPAGDSEEEEA